MWKAEGWEWIVRCYYGDKSVPPKYLGQLAIETRHKSASSKDMEVEAGNSRTEIGTVEVIKL